MIVIGIDPGLSGAVAVLKDNTFSFYDTPTIKLGQRLRLDTAGLVDIIRPYCAPYIQAHAFLEAVHTHPQEGPVGAFTFGRSLGMWEGILAGLEVPYTMVAPQSWKAKMVKGLPKDKNSSIVRLLQLYPQLSSQLSRVKDHNRADAALLALYGLQYILGA